MKTVHLIFAHGVPDASFQKLVKSLRDMIRIIPETQLAEDLDQSAVSADLAVVLDEYYSERSHLQECVRRSLGKPILLCFQQAQGTLPEDAVRFSSADEIVVHIERALYPAGLPAARRPFYN